MIEKIKKYLIYMGLSEEEYYNVLSPIAEDNMRYVLAWSMFTAFIWVLCLVLSLKLSDYAACRIVYIGALTVSIITMLGAILFPKPIPWLRILLINLLLFSALGAGIGIAICQPGVRTVSMIAFAVIIPTCIIGSTIDDIIRHVVTIIAYMILAKNVIEPEIYSWELMNLLIFSFAGIMISHVINKSRFERYVYAEAAKELADIQAKLAYHDHLTGFKNRRAYAERMKELEDERPEQLCIVIADLNGLKQTNDTLGHDAGDALIIGASECISEAFENADSIYRIGGDEFCIITKGTKEEAERCAKKLDKLAEGWSKPAIDHLSICYGIADGTNTADIDSVVKMADRAMYENKRNYYKNSSADRRQR